MAELDSSIFFFLQNCKIWGSHSGVVELRGLVYPEDGGTKIIWNVGSYFMAVRRVIQYFVSTFITILHLLQRFYCGWDEREKTFLN